MLAEETNKMRTVESSGKCEGGDQPGRGWETLGKVVDHTAKQPHSWPGAVYLIIC